MSPSVILVPDIPRRFGYLAERKVIRATIPAGAIGTYLLLNNSRPLYVGRSDHCVLTRLLTHEHLAAATHVVWEPCKTVFQAFALEAAWYHEVYQAGTLINRIHPARPFSFEGDCPFCCINDLQALTRSLPLPMSHQLCSPTP